MRTEEILSGVEVHGMTRGAFILRGALAAGAACGAGAVGPYVTRALAQAGGGDVAIANFALTLEYVEVAFYKAALADGKLRADLKKLATQLGKDEQAHADTLNQVVQQLGGNAVKVPVTSFPVKSDASFLRIAATLEETGVSAYNGAVPGLTSADLLLATGSIVNVEARHAAAIHQAAGQNEAPNAFDRPLSPPAALARVKPYVKG